VLKVLGGIVLMLVLVAIPLTTLLSVFVGGGYGGSGGTAPVGAVYGGENAVTLAAKQMAAHLNSTCLKEDPNPDCLGDASFDEGFPATILGDRYVSCHEGQGSGYYVYKMYNYLFLVLDLDSVITKSAC
jgi:hypothetical protein